MLAKFLAEVLQAFNRIFLLIFFSEDGGENPRMPQIATGADFCNCDHYADFFRKFPLQYLTDLSA